MLAKTKKTLEELDKSFGISGKVKTTSTTTTKTTKSDKSKQSKSSARSLEDLDKQFGIGKPKKKTVYGPKLDNNTTNKPTAFYTETKNAYDTRKNISITSNMTDEERQSRIKEINVELANLSKARSGLDRAKLYGNVDDMIAENESRQAELSRELKELQRVGTFEASEVMQFAIDDAKAKKSALPKYNPTARISSSQVDEFLENQKARSDIDKEIASLEAQQAAFRKFERDDELNSHTTKILSNPDFVAENYNYSPLKPKTDEELKAEGYRQDADGKWYKLWGMGFREGYTGEDSDLYTYINDPSKRLSLEVDKEMLTGSNTYKDLGYHTLTADERKAFNYLYHQDRKNGTNTAEEYLQTISPLLQERALAIEEGRYAELAKEAPVGMSVVSLGTNLANGLMFPVKVAATASGSYDDMPMLDKYGNRTQAIRGAVSEDMGTWGKLAYNAGMSIGDMGVAMLAGGGNAKVVQAIMSSSAGSSTISEAKKNGASDGKALVLGLGSAAIEWATEKYSVEAILKKPESILGYITTNILTEGTEEGASNISNLALDAIVSEVFGERNAIEQRMDYLMLYEGKTQEEALKIAFIEKAQSLGEDVLVGGLTGFGMSSVVATPTIIDNAAKKSDYVDTFVNDEKSLDALIEEGKSRGVGTASAKIAEEIEQAKQKGNVTRGQIKQLIKANDRNEKTVQQPAQPDTLEQAARDVVESRNKTNGFETLEARKTGKVTAETLENLSRANVEITADEVKKVTGFGEEGSKLVANYANVEGATFSQVVREVKSSYMTGHEQPDLDIKKVAHTFTSPAQENAYTAGQMDGKMQALVDKESAKNAVVNKESGFNAQNLPSDVTQTQAEIIDLMAKGLGYKSFMAKGLKGNAEINHDTGEVAIDFDFEREIEVDGKKQKVSAVFHAAHEMALHGVVKRAPEEGRAFVYAMYRHLAGNEAMLVTTLADQKRDAYAKQNVDISLAVAMEEISANSILYLYGNDEGKFHKAIDSIVNGNDAKAKQGLSKYIEYLKDIIRKIRDYLVGKTGKTKADGQAALDEVTRLRDMFETAVAKAVENTKAAQSQEVVENATTEGDVDFSLKNAHITADMSDADRTKILSTKSVVAPIYEGQADESIENNLADLNSGKMGLVKTAIVAISEQFGIIGEDIQIEDVDVEIRLSKSNLRESVSKKANPTELAKLIPVLEEAVSNAIGIERHDNRYYYDTSTVYFENLLGGFVDGVYFVPVRFGLKHSKNGQATLYVVVDQNKIPLKALEQIKKTEVVKTPAPLRKETATSASRSVKYTISQIIPFVKSKDLLRYIPDNMLDNEQKRAKWEAVAETIKTTAEKNDKKYKQYISEGKIYEAQKMLEAAAKAHGYTESGYHGTGADFNIFSEEKIGGRNVWGKGFYFGKSKAIADDYASFRENKGGKYRIVSAYLKMGESFTPHKSSLGTAEEILDRWFSDMWTNSRDLGVGYIDGKLENSPLDLLQFIAEHNNIEIRDVLREYGYNSVKDGGELVVFNANQIKSADTITYDDNDNIIPISERFNEQSNDIRYSLKDSEGKILTKAQQEYFKDSKVKDENGNLLVMYQGASEDFTVFDRRKSSYANLYGRGFYFTRSENHASQYGKTRAYYLLIKHPVSTTETTITKEQLRKFLKAVTENEDYSFENYGYGATVDSVLQSIYGKSDFLMLNDVSQTAIGDLVEAVELFNEVNGTDYDGIVLATETVTFNSEQAKLTTNTNPTSDPDINFSLKKSVEETKNLIAVHNMQSSELERTLDLGGLPMPSIAIIKAQSGHSEYGDVSLVFDKSVIDPKANKLNKVYGGDAWTPTYPTIEYKPNEKIADKISGKYYEMARKFGNDEARPLYNYVYDLERQLNTYKGETKMISNLYENTDLMQLYLLDSGKEKVETIKKETRKELTDADVEMREFFIKELGADVVDGVVWDGNGAPFAYRKNYMSKYEDVIRETYKKLLSEVYKFSDEQVQNVLDSTKQSDYLKFVRDAYNYRKDGRVTIITENDYSATQQAIREAVGEDYRKWVDSLFKGIEEKSGIRNNVDYFTNSGNRRSWEALHWENNLENVVKVMKGQDDVGSVGFFSGQNIWGVAAKNYGSIEEIKADSDRLKQLPEEEYSKIKVGFGERLEEIAHSIMDKDERNPFIASDNAMECIVDAVRNSKTKSGILNRLKQYRQLTVTETTVDDIVALVSDISNMPTEYFEAKPKRAVELNEIAAAIIPDSISKDTKARLDSLGIKYLEYEAGNENARLEALNSLEDVQFSLKGTSNINTKDQKELLDIIEHLKGEFEVTKFAKADPKKLAKMTRDILKEYNSKADYDETYKEIDALYQYMANGEDGHTAVWEDVYSRAYNVAQKIVENALVVDDYMYQTYKSLRDYLRNTPIKFDARHDSVPSSYENFNEFRKMNMGRLNFTNNGMSIDYIYQELSGLYPEFFNAEEQITSEEQFETIIDVLDQMRPTEVNPFDRQIEQVSMQLANDLTSRFFDIPQAKPTFADKAERRVVETRIHEGKKLTEVRKRRDERIKNLIKKHNAKTKERLDRLRADRDVKVEKEKQIRRNSLAKMSEKQRAKVLRARIIRHTAELNKTLLKATDKKHIPPELENAVLALLYNVNMESNYSYDVESDSYKKNDKGLPTNKTKAFLSLKEVYADIATNNDYGLTLASELYDSTGDGVTNIFDEVMKLSDKKIADMNSEELTKIWDAIRLIEHSIATANKMFAMQKWEDLTKTAKAFEDSVATRRAKHALMKNHLTLDFETPITFFSHFGEAGLELYQSLRIAQDNEQNMIDELAEVVGGIVSLEEVQKAEKDIYEITTMAGKKLTLTKAHIMDIYLLYNREQGRKHLLYDPDGEYFGNGIRQPEIKGKNIRRGTESIRLNKADLGNIISKLNASDKAIADKMQKATLLLAKWGNKACMEVFGYEKFNDPNYWTIKSAPEGTNQTPEKNKDVARSIKNMGSAKSVEDKATNALDIGGVFDVFNQHASDMICYSAWLGVMEDATKLYNYTLRDNQGKKTSTTFRDLLNKYAGEGGGDYYFNLMKDIQNGIGILPDTATERIYTKLYGMAAKAKVAFKATVVAQQPMSIVRASTVINPLSIIQATAKGGVNLPVWSVTKVKNLVTKDSVQESEWYGGWQRALKYAPIASRKAIGGYEINSNSSGLKGVLYKPDTLKGKTIDALKESPLWAAGKADEITWGILWNACEIETRRNTDLEKGSEAFYKAVAELFNKVINETQVVDGVLQRSQIMRTSSGWVKPMTAFKGEPIMALNVVMRAYDSLRYEANPAKRGKAIKAFGRATTVFLMSAVFTAFARSLAVGVTGEDDEEYWKKVWKSFSGIQGDEETWFDFVKNVGLKSDAVNNVNPLSWLPLASELMSSAQGYDVERLDVASVGEFFQAGKTFVDSLDAEGKYKVGYATRNLLLKASELTGYSPNNLIRDIEGAIRTTRVENNDVRGLYDMEKWRTKPASNASKYIDILYKAYSTDNEAYEYIYDDMIKNGVDAEKIQSGMENRMKKAEGVEKASDLTKRYMTPDDEKKYDSSLNKVKTSGAWKSATSTQRKNAEADLYDFLTSTSEAMEKTRAEARAFGVDETEYTLWQLAKEMVNDSKDSMNAIEKAAAIEMLDLGNSELAYFYNTETADKAYAAGVDIENFAMFKGAVSGLKGDNKKALVDKYARKYASTTKEYLFFMGSEYSSYKKRSDYIRYFGK